MLMILGLMSFNTMTYADSLLRLNEKGFSLTDSQTGQKVTWKEALIGKKVTAQQPSQQVVQAQKNTSSVYTQQDINKVFTQEELSAIAQKFVQTNLKTQLNAQYGCQSAIYNIEGIQSTYCFSPVIIKQINVGQTNNIYMLIEGKMPDGGGAPDPGIGIMLKISYQVGAIRPIVISYKENFGGYGNANLALTSSFTQLGINQYGWVINTGFKEESNIRVFGEYNNQIKLLSNTLTYACIICMGEDAFNQNYNTSDEIKFIAIDQSTTQGGYYSLKFQQIRSKLSKKNKVTTTTKILTIPFNAVKQQYDFPYINN